ncbi:MAG: efflux RND transporter periplasmic adaptor subunit [Isosphaeraceae bacterium]
MLRKLLIFASFAIAVAGGIWALAASGWTVARVQGALRDFAGRGSATTVHGPSQEVESKAKSEGPWDGSIALDDKQMARIGLKVASVKAQTESTRLNLIAATEYDPNTLTVVRPLLDNSRVDFVHKSVGDQVKVGEPLIDLFSGTLAAAKTAVEKEYSEWQHDLRLLESRRELFEKGSITKQNWADIVNDEAKSRLEWKLARDQLEIYGLTPREIDRASEETGAQKGKMTIRSLAAGLVIKRDVVPGNLYDKDDDLMTIAPLDRLWVIVSVPEGDAYKVKLGQSLRVIFPYNRLEFEEKVDHIYSQIDPITRSVKFRTSIPNYEGRLRSGMYARAELFRPPPDDERRTVIPRAALVTTDGACYVFVEEPDLPGKFYRKLVQVAEEYHDVVYLTDSLEPGEKVACEGSLILAQMYEDRATQR